MGDERLRELGIPRRSFLKRAGTAAFVVPVVVSFGLDGIAEAKTPSFPNQKPGDPGAICKDGGWQRFGNQFKNQGDCVSFFATGGKNPPAG